MKLSIITVNYNNLSGLKKTAESVLIQSLSNCTEWEWVIVDGGSTDGSAEFVETIKKYTGYAVSEPDGGIYEAMNKGVEHCHGEFCLFLNSGDLLYRNNSVAKCLETIRRNKAVDIFRFAVTLELDGKVTGVCYPAEKITGINLFSSSIAHQGTVIKTELLKKHPYDTKYKIMADCHFFARIYLYEKALDWHSNDILSRYDCSGVSSSRYTKVLDEKKALFTELTSAVIYEDYARFCYGESLLEKLVCKFRKKHWLYYFALVSLLPLYAIYCSVSLVVNYKFLAKKYLNCKSFKCKR